MRQPASLAYGTRCEPWRNDANRAIIQPSRGVTEYMTISEFNGRAGRGYALPRWAETGQMSDGGRGGERASVRPETGGGGGRGGGEGGAREEGGGGGGGGGGGATARRRGRLRGRAARRGDPGAVRA